MRISLAISLLIIALAALIGWRDHHELAGLRSENYRLSGEAAAMGISPDDSVQGRAHQRHKRERVDKLAEARGAALDIIGIARELKRLEESGEPADTAMQDRILGGLERIRSMDGDQLLAMISEFRIVEKLDDTMRSMLLTVTTDALTDRDPRAALELLSADGQPLVDSRNRVSLVLKSLANWAETDPDVSLAWLHANPLDFMANQAMELALVEGAARTNQKLAIDLIKELGIVDKGTALRGIALKLSEPGERTELLRLMRDSSGFFVEHEIHEALANMAPGVAGEGFGKGVAWIEQNKLSAGELNFMIQHIATRAGNADKGRWIEWMGSNLPADSRDGQIEFSIRDWTASDHRAAGEWLAALPDGPAKPASVAVFAKTVALHDPKIAAQWALTLPPGGKRNDTLKAVYEKWPQDDPARASFMAEHPVE